MKRIAKSLLLSLGILVILNGFAVCFLANFNVGTVLTLLLGLVLLLLPPLWRKMPKPIKIIVIIGFLLLSMLLGFFFCYGKTDTADYREDVLIVLGAGIKGQEISADLQNRLDTAVQYYQQNPRVLIVVSGGQGPDEDISEALAMQRYLTAKGIPKEQILLEDRSTSTKENFVYTKELLSKYFQDEYTAAFVTSDFHILRAEILAGHEGFDHIRHLHSSSPFYTVLPNGLRECLAYAKLWLLDT